jgi:hypothetical protein
MHFDKYSFGALRIDGSTYEQDVVINCREIRKCKGWMSKLVTAAPAHPRPYRDSASA